MKVVWMKYSALVVFAALSSGCSLLGTPSISQEYAAAPAIAANTSTQQLLEALPPTTTPIMVSVYAFSDQTGQHKPDELPQYSRAVTQGGLAFLKKALWDAGSQRWFRVLERGGLAHLLKEREIIRSVRAEYRAPSGEQLPNLGPLLYSGLLLEGGIIAYESNEITGGIGARYLGIGGGTEYRRDIVTVSLRAVSVSTGEVVAAVTTSKTIFSLGINGGVFKYVTFDELLEGEAGFSMNEPPQLAVRQAIELAVYSLIMKGYEKGLWNFSDTQAGRKAYDEYVTRFNVPARPPGQTAANGRPAPQGQRTAPKPQAQSQSTPRPSERNTAAADNPVKSVIRTGTLQADASHPDLCHPELPEASTTLSEGYYFQIAALKPIEPNAKVIRESFIREGLPVKVQKAVVGGSPYCRILVGPYRDAATALLQSARIAGIAAACTDGESEPFLREIK